MTQWPTLSTSSVRSLQFKLQCSRTFLVAIVFVHALAAVASFSNALPLWSRMLLFGAVGLSLIILLKRYIFFDPAEMVEVAWSEDDGWHLRCRAQEAVPVRLLGTSVVTTVVTILHFKTEQGKRHEIVVFRDALDAESYRLCCG
jgi:Membrane-bound toxin component of toxin-antitoxin system